MEVIGISKEEFDKRINELERRVMDMSDRFTVDSFKNDLRIYSAGKEYRIKTVNGVDLCPKCRIIGIYDKPSSTGHITLCESCGYQPYTAY